MIRTIIGVLFLLFGALDLWKFGWTVLVHTPQLLIGVILVALGGGLVGRPRFLP